MKIKAHVIGVEDNGEVMTVKAQGQGVRDAAWRGMCGYTFPLTTNKANRRAFYIGRQFEIVITPK